MRTALNQAVRALRPGEVRSNSATNLQAIYLRVSGNILES